MISKIFLVIVFFFVFVMCTNLIFNHINAWAAVTFVLTVLYFVIKKVESKI